MRQYLDLVRKVLDDGVDSENRTDTPSRSIFGYQMRFDLERGFPLLTTKKVSFHNIKAELLWMLSGNENIDGLHEHGVKIWDEWASEDGTFGPIYGAQWRSWPKIEMVEAGEEFSTEPQHQYLDNFEGGRLGVHYVDQLAEAINTIKTNPNSRRIIVSAWNVGEIENMALPPCHALFQFHVSGGKLSCQMYQRSADVFLGVPYNIASYALLTHMVAQVCGLGVGELIWTGGNCHLYDNHRQQMTEQLFRLPMKQARLILDPTVADIDGFEMDDIQLEGYESHAAIKGAISV